MCLRASESGRPQANLVCNNEAYLVTTTLRRLMHQWSVSPSVSSSCRFKMSDIIHPLS